MTVADELARRRRHAFVKSIGLWPWYGYLSYRYYAWAQRQIAPTNPDAAKVGRRYYQLRQEFAK